MAQMVYVNGMPSIQEARWLIDGMEARREMLTNRQRDQQGTVHDLMYRPDAVAPMPVHIKRITKAVRNFAMENKKHVRLIAAENHARRAAERQEATMAATEAARPSSSRYSNVESRVFREPETGSSEGSAARTDPEQLQSAFQPQSIRPASSVPSISGAASCRSLLQCDKKNFVRMNEIAAKHPKPVQGNADYVDRTEGYLQKLDRLPKARPGEIPAYLMRRNKEWEQAAVDAEEAVETAKIPAGCQLMDEEEKAEIIADLRRTKAEKEMELFKLPVRSDTLRVRTKRADLEAELSRLEDHLELLSKPKVFVPIED
ncbi:hypothetical protein BV898_09835 [Hypsibius exemplaris]|uniref:Enkurin domain-containing protein n=1 Tax=Hypsibius exemplaris TaxID=2072580 RepID=A0A1W0WLI6_HYPEX|nr:hypothetical protein BV898_09835 [Hypsibius exemplaris]